MHFVIQICIKNVFVKEIQTQKHYPYAELNDKKYENKLHFLHKILKCIRKISLKYKILRDDSQTVGNSPLWCSSASLNPTYLSTYLKYR